MGVRVLLIEDDETIAEPLADGLRHFGLTVHHVATGADGLRGPYGDVVLLDLGLPDMDGIDVCRGIRRTSDVPLIILSARGEEADRVLGLELGADDYLAKPFSIRELVARIRAVSRRHQRPGSGAPPGEELGARLGSANGGGLGTGAGSGVGVEAGAGTGVAGRSGGGFGAESDFTDTSAFGSGNGLGGEGASRVGDEESGRTAAGDTGRRAGPGDGSTGRPEAGPGVGAREAEYDWSTAYETPVQGAPARRASARDAAAGDPAARETSARRDGARGAQPYDARPVPGDPIFGDPAFDGTPAQGTPPHGSPMYAGPAHGAPTYGTPPHGSPTFANPPYGTPAHGNPVYEPPVYDPSVNQSPAYEPPVYEPPMYEQAPPEPRPPSGSATGDNGSAPPPPGPLVVDRRTRQVWVGEVPVALTPKEFELLALLTEDPGAVYSRQQILNRVWDDHYQGPTKTLDVHVATLRRKLGDPAWIQTLRGVGFRLAVRTPGQAPGQGRPQTHGQGQGHGRGRGGSGRHRTPEARAS